VSLVIVAVENLRIGGYQRLALDQVYHLSDIAQNTLLLLVDREVPGLRTFEETEKNLIDSKNFQIRRMSGKRVSDLFEIRKFLRLQNVKVLIVSHSLRSTVLFALARVGLRKEIMINSTIHQLPSLSKFVQRMKRFIYAQFGDHIYAYSDAVRKDWLNRYSNFGKPISLLRNGIYIDRLNIFERKAEAKPPRLIYLGRNTSWKGIDIYFKLFNLPIFSNYEGLMMIAKSSLEIESAAQEHGIGRIKIVEGANLSDFKARENDLHVYPSQYGDTAEYTESISLNCLEMALLGIPSLVTPSNEDTWPELTNAGVFIAADWKHIEEKQDAVMKKISNIKEIEKAEVVGLISISNNVNRHLDSLR